MRPSEISVTEAARRFSEFLNRVAYRQEQFLLVRGRRAVAELRPAPAGRSLQELPLLWKNLPSLNGAECRSMARDLRPLRAFRRA
jgi:hypothetical protein